MTKSEKPASLADLKPTERKKVYDLVGEAGLNMSDWSNYKIPSRPAANPRYSYEWAFSQPGKPVVLCLWYPSMIEKDGVIFHEMKAHPPKFNSRGHAGNDVRVRRAKRMDDAIAGAASAGLPIRVIVLDGVRRSDENNSASKVTRRLLDPNPWAVETYDSETGECRLVRGMLACGFADQFSVLLDDQPRRRLVTGDTFVRSAEVRGRVLRRAKGMCEHCGSPGFKMADGRIYLETHHIVALSENGADTHENVIALCPNDHREAHYGAKSAEMGTRLTSVVQEALRKRPDS